MRGGGKETLIPAVLLAVEMWMGVDPRVGVGPQHPKLGFFSDKGCARCLRGDPIPKVCC